AFANTSGTAAYPAARPRAPAPNTSPFPRKSRREILSMPMICMPISISSLLQLELRRGEEDEPAGLVIARRVQQLRGRLADYPVDVRLVRVPERRQFLHRAERRDDEVHAREDVVARDPRRVGRPAADLRRVEEGLAHPGAGLGDRLRELRGLEGPRDVDHELRR